MLYDKMNSSTHQQWALLKIMMINVPNACSEQRHEGALFIKHTHINMATPKYIHGYTPIHPWLHPWMYSGSVVVVGFWHFDNLIIRVIKPSQWHQLK